MRSPSYIVANGVLLIYLLHVFRNVSFLYFGVLALGLCVLVLLLFVEQKHWRLDPLAMFFCLAWVYGAAVSLVAPPPPGELSVGLVRMWASLPMVLVASVLSRGELKLPMLVFVSFYCLAALGYPYQYLAGPIDWLADSSERAGIARFSSLVGSLTAYGTYVGIAVLAAGIYLKGMMRMVVVSLLASGALLSLQKSSVASVLLGIVILFLFSRYKVRGVASSVFLIVVCAGFAFLLQMNSSGEVVAGVADNVIGMAGDGGDLSQDVGLVQSMVDRFVNLPSEAFEYHGLTTVVLGAGVAGGAGALGFEEVPMAHNGIVELILVFGMVVGGALVIAMLWMLVLALQFLFDTKRLSPDALMVSSGYLVWLLNFVFTGGGLFHPIGAALFWIFVLRLCVLLECRAAGLYGPKIRRPVRLV